MVWYSYLSQNFPQLTVIHTVKGFGIVSKAEIDVFLELSWFFLAVSWSTKRGREEIPQVRGQGWPGEATLHARPGAVTLKSHLEPEARGGSWKEQSEEWWLLRHRRA